MSRTFMVSCSYHVRPDADQTPPGNIGSLPPLMRTEPFVEVTIKTSEHQSQQKRIYIEMRSVMATANTDGFPV
jgi:hypothetical protein